MNSVNHPQPPNTWVSRASLRLGILTGLLLLAGQTPAQNIYRSLTPDGKVTFADKPIGAAAKITVTDAAGKPQGEGSTALPFELRQVVSKYPVTLYTSTNCPPCSTGRTLLTSHGIPFTEKTISTVEDTQALQRLSGENSLPFLTLGAQQIKGYSESEWMQFLDAAGYPKSSALPAKYRNPAATPLVMVKKPAPATPTADNAAIPATALPMPTSDVSNPTGIQF